MEGGIQDKSSNILTVYKERYGNTVNVFWDLFCTQQEITEQQTQQHTLMIMDVVSSTDCQLRWPRSANHKVKIQLQK